MSEEKQYDNSGALFANKEKDADHPKWPDYNGSLTVDSIEYWLSGWVKTAKSGKKFLSLSVKLKTPKAETADNTGSSEPDTQVDSYSLPF